jgi:hypothetical protein
MPPFPNMDTTTANKVAHQIQPFTPHRPGWFFGQDLAIPCIWMLYIFE